MVPLIIVGIKNLLPGHFGCLFANEILDMLEHGCGHGALVQLTEGGQLQLRQLVTSHIQHLHHTVIYSLVEEGKMWSRCF
jgi:hypothetical protein